MADIFEPGTPGKRQFISQVENESYPLTNCRVASLMMQLVYAGLKIPDKRKAILTWRKATGVPEVVGGSTMGTTAADMIRAGEILTPWVPIVFGHWDPNELFDEIRDGNLTASFGFHYRFLPVKLRRWSPNFKGGHSCAVLGARGVGANREVFWCDPLGRGDFDGEWVKWSIIRDAVFDSGFATGSRLYATTIRKGVGMSTSVVLRVPYSPPATFVAPKGVKSFIYDDEALTFRSSKVIANGLSGNTDCRVAVDQKPYQPPTGDFIRIVGGTHAGKYLRASEVKVTIPPVGDCQPQVDAAVQAAVASAHAEYAPVAEPVYTRSEP